MANANQPSTNVDKKPNSTFINAVDRAVEVALRVANVWAQRAGSIFETTGNFLSGVLDAFGEILNGIPVAAKVLRGMLHWLGTIVSAGFDLAAMLICSLLNLVANGLAGMVRVLVGVLSVIIAREGQLARKGVVDILSGITGAVIAIVAKTVALIHAVIFMQMGERPLNDYEKAIVARVYRNSITAKNIRIVEGFAGLFNTNKRPFTLGNRIYLKQVDSAKDPALFAHECCHIWQYQRDGVRYIAEALWAQFFVQNAYSWETEIARGHARWQDLNREAQAQFILDVFNSGRQKPPINKAGEFYNDDPIGENVEYKRNNADHTELARNAIALIRNKGVS